MIYEGENSGDIQSSWLHSRFIITLYIGVIACHSWQPVIFLQPEAFVNRRRLCPEFLVSCCLPAVGLRVAESAPLPLFFWAHLASSGVGGTFRPPRSVQTSQRRGWASFGCRLSVHDGRLCFEALMLTNANGPSGGTISCFLPLPVLCVSTDLLQKNTKNSSFQRLPSLCLCIGELLWIASFRFLSWIKVQKTCLLA